MRAWGKNGYFTFGELQFCLTSKRVAATLEQSQKTMSGIISAIASISNISINIQGCHFKHTEGKHFLSVQSVKSHSLLSALSPLQSLCFPHPKLEGGDKCDLN